jgi:hypothetical protein
MESQKQFITEVNFDKELLNKKITSSHHDDNNINKSTKNKKSKKRKFKEPKKCQLEECNKKLGLVKIKCKCGLYFCPKHRTCHNCTFDYRKNSNLSKNLNKGNSNFKKIDKI